MRWLLVAVLAGVILTSCSSSGTTAHQATQSHAVTTCPSEPQISAASGVAFSSSKTASTGGNLVCSYSEPTTNASLVFSIAGSAISPTAFRAALVTAASATHERVSPVPGYGTVAYLVEFPPGQAGATQATNFNILDGTKVIRLFGTLSLPQTEAVARYILGQ